MYTKVILAFLYTQVRQRYSTKMRTLPHTHTYPVRIPHAQSMRGCFLVVGKFDVRSLVRSPTLLPLTAVGHGRMCHLLLRAATFRSPLPEFAHRPV